VAGFLFVRLTITYPKINKPVKCSGWQRQLQPEYGERGGNTSHRVAGRVDAVTVLQFTDLVCTFSIATVLVGGKGRFRVRGGNARVTWW